jgi:sulfur carrier protein ThiS
MHRGSSKVPGAPAPAAESLPLSASSRPVLTVEVEVARAGRSTVRTFTVPVGTRVRDVIRHVHEAPEGSVALRDGASIPLDTALDRSVRLVVLPTFSGG